MKTYNNKYYKWYDHLIDRARNRTIEGYVERHHIVPRSLGGTDEESNLVKLTAREHLIAHMLLPRFVENKAPMWQAVWMMMNTQGRKLTGRLYEQARIEYRGIQKGRKMSPEFCAKMSAALKGRKLSPEHIAKMSAAQKGRKLSPEHIAKMSAVRKGIKKSPETLAKMSAALKGRKHSPETLAKISAAKKGIKRSPETCAKMSAARKGIKRSPETCAKMSAAKKGRKHSPETLAKRQATRAANRALKTLQCSSEHHHLQKQYLEKTPSHYQVLKLKGKIH